MEIELNSNDHKISNNNYVTTLMILLNLKIIRFH